MKLKYKKKSYVYAQSGKTKPESIVAWQSSVKHLLCRATAQQYGLILPQRRQEI